MNDLSYLLFVRSSADEQRCFQIDESWTGNSTHNEYREWTPTIWSIFPDRFRGARRDLVLNWVFGLFGWLRGRGFRYRVAFLETDEGAAVAQCIVSESSNRFSFMSYSDCQIGAVFVPLSLRGRGLARELISNVLRKTRCSGTTWWACDPANNASIRLAQSLGFRLVGRAVRSGRFVPVYRRL